MFNVSMRYFAFNPKDVTLEVPQYAYNNKPGAFNFLYKAGDFSAEESPSGSHHPDEFYNLLAKTVYEENYISDSTFVNNGPQGSAVSVRNGDSPLYDNSDPDGDYGFYITGMPYSEIADEYDYGGDLLAFPFHLIASVDLDWHFLRSRGGDDIIRLPNEQIASILHYGRAYNKAFFAGSGNDFVQGAGRVDDIVHAEEGDDILMGLAGNDFLDGGDGSDTASYWKDAENGGQNGIVARIFEKYVIDSWGHRDELKSIESIIATNYSDTVYGDDLDNVLSGLGGADSLFAEKGRDKLFGGDGNDILYSVDPHLAVGPDRLDGGADADIFVVDDQDIVVSVNSGDQIIVPAVFATTDVLVAFDGNNTFIYQFEGAPIPTQVIQIEQGISSKRFDVSIVDGLYDGLYLKVRPGQLQEGILGFGSTALNPAKARSDFADVWNASVDDVLAGLQSDLLPDIRDTGLGWLGKYVSTNSFSAITVALGKIASKASIVLPATELAAAGSALIVSEMNGEFKGTMADRVLLWADAFNSSLNPFADTTEAVVRSGVRLGEAAMNVLISDAIAAFVAPLLMLQGAVSNGTGTDGSDTQNGTEGSDFIYLKKGDDKVRAGAGDDIIIGGSGAGNDLYDGEDGVDMVAYGSTTEGIVVDLATGAASGTEIDNDELISIEEIVGGTGDDWISGDDHDNSFNGGGGVDTLIGGLGDDTLDGGLHVGAAPAGWANELYGGDGDDTYIIRNSLDRIDEGGYRPDLGAGGTDTVISHANWFWDHVNVGEKLIIAEDAADASGAGTTLVATVFNNDIIGNSKTNILFGRGGSDTYRAGDGIDFISLSLLGVPENYYPGVNGVNTIVVEARASGTTSYDIVFEFESGKDKLDVSDYGFASAAAAFATGVDAGDNSYFVLGDGFDYLYMVGLNLSELSAGDFVV